jgi:hypothetical protein
MNTTRVRSLAFVPAVLFASSAAVLPAAEPAKEDAALASKLITAIEKSDYDTFVADADAPFQKALKKQLFATTAAGFAPHFQGGYAVSYLGDLQQTGRHVTLWKISFKNHRDDALVTVVMKGGKVAGFWIQ